jgi:hypothetical protein
MQLVDRGAPALMRARDIEEYGPFPFRVTFTVLPADRHQFVINSGKVPEELAVPARDK